MVSNQIPPFRAKPTPGLTTIEYVTGGASDWFAPKQVEAWQLPFRFAVIQDTYRPDKSDMFHDKSVWLRLLAFASEFLPDQAPVIVDHGGAKSRYPHTSNEERSCEAYFAATKSDADEDWDAPEFIIVRENGALALLIATEHWSAVGGPPYYHDSLTYSIYSKTDLSDRVMQFMRDAPDASGWNLAPTPMPPPDPPPPSVANKLFSWLKRDA